MTELIQKYGKEIIALLVPFIAWALSYFFRAKAKLLLSTPHAFTFLVEEPLKNAEGEVIAESQNVHTRSLLLSNAGKVTATKVELVFNWKPMCLNIWPPRHFEEHTEADGRYTLVFESMAPGEYFDCELLSVNNKLPELLTARSDQCTAQNIVMYPQPHIANWKKRIAGALLLAGLALVVYLSFVLLQFVILKTPFGH